MGLLARKTPNFLPNFATRLALWSSEALQYGALVGRGTIESNIVLFLFFRKKKTLFVTQIKNTL